MTGNRAIRVAYSQQQEQALVNIKRKHRRAWEDLFCNPWDWWDNRLDKKGPSHPDFRHKLSRQVLWLNDWHRPPWVDSELPALTSANTRRHAFLQKLQSLCDLGHLDAALHAIISCPDPHIARHIDAYVSLLAACAKANDLAHARHVCALLPRQTLASSGSANDHLVVALVNCGILDDAHQILLSLPHRSVHSWTIMILGYISQGRACDALSVCQFMEEDGIQPDCYVYVHLLKACSLIPDLHEAEKLHVQAQMKGFTCDVYLGNTLISTYSKCGYILAAENVFNSLCGRNDVTWSAMLSAYVEQGQGEMALRLYRQMQEEGINLSQQSFIMAIQACTILSGHDEAMVDDQQAAHMEPIVIGRTLHANARKKGFTADVFVSNAILTMYGKCESISEAENVFAKLINCDFVSWNAMVSAYLEQHQGDKALQMYKQMQEEGINPDRQSLAIALQACATIVGKYTVVGKPELDQVTALEIGRALHADAERMGFISDSIVNNTLITMYGRCGSIREAESVFDGLAEPSLIAWSALLSAFVEHGLGEKALLLYKHMKKAGVALDDMSIFALLKACRMTGSIDMCRQLHFALIFAGYDINPMLCRALIGVYASCSFIADALEFFNGLPQHDVLSWTACITGYAQVGNCDASLQILKAMSLAGIPPNEITFLCLLSACSCAGLVDKGMEIYNTMSKEYGITPKLKHWVTMIDLLGRTGEFEKMEFMLAQLPQGNQALWISILSACHKYGNVNFGKQVFDHIVGPNAQQAPGTLVSDLCCNTGLQNWADAVDELLQSRKDNFKHASQNDF